jgi:hypothetical protein
MWHRKEEEKKNNPKQFSGADGGPCCGIFLAYVFVGGDFFAISGNSKHFRKQIKKIPTHKG